MSIQSMCTGEPQLVPDGLRGYRMFTLDYETGALRATSANASWAVEMTAECHRTSLGFGAWTTTFVSFGGKPLFDGQAVEAKVTHEAPSKDCECGIYGWYHPDEKHLHRGDIFGVIEASGRVLLGDYGFRSQRARVLALAYTEDNTIRQGRQAVEWGERWGVPVYDSHEALAEAFPPDDVTELIGDRYRQAVEDDLRANRFAVGGVIRGVPSITFNLNATAFAEADEDDGDPKVRALKQKRPSTTPPMWAEPPERRKRRRK